MFSDEANDNETPEIGRWLVLPLLEPGNTLPVDFNQAPRLAGTPAVAVTSCLQARREPFAPPTP
ncbi:hypothetical protein [Nonomuraea roseola]|uniref:Uncharacterized protein n=1 Tax=Nonomuraea roseola TaxID=46179 RepID=A0ABV5PTB2_9ACTN